MITSLVMSERMIIGFENRFARVGYGVTFPLICQWKKGQFCYSTTPSCDHFSCFGAKQLQEYIKDGLLIVGLRPMICWPKAMVLYTQEAWQTLYPPFGKHDWQTVHDQQENEYYAMVLDYDAAQEHLAYWQEISEE